LHIISSMRQYSLLIIVILFHSIVSFADVDLIVWQPEPNAPRIILPKIKNETPKQSVARYLQNLRLSEQLKSIVPRTFHFREGRTEMLDQEDFKGRVRLAINANTFEDMRISGERIQRNIKVFESVGANPYVIALSAEINLAENEAERFRQKVSEYFSVMVSLGGNDVDPNLYNEKNRHAIDTNYFNDQLELKRIRYFKDANRGVFFGICRGHQLGAVADGHQLYQDLTADNIGRTGDHVRIDGDNSTSKQMWHHITIQNSLLMRFLRGQTHMLVNSIHHQAVKLNQNGDSFPIAYDDTGLIVEALQSKNNKSISVQFHAEFPVEVSGQTEFSRQGHQIIKGIVSYARTLRLKRYSAEVCKRLFNSY